MDEKESFNFWSDTSKLLKRSAAGYTWVPDGASYSKHVAIECLIRAAPHEHQRKWFPEYLLNVKSAWSDAYDGQ